MSILWFLVPLTIICTLFVAYFAGIEGGRTVQHRPVAVLRRKFAELALDVADLEALYASLLESHKRLASREAVARRRAKVAADLEPGNVPDPEKNPTEYKNHMRLVHLTPGKGKEL